MRLPSLPPAAIAAHHVAQAGYMCIPLYGNINQARKQ